MSDKTVTDIDNETDNSPELNLDNEIQEILDQGSKELKQLAKETAALRKLAESKTPKEIDQILTECRARISQFLDRHTVIGTYYENEGVWNPFANYEAEDQPTEVEPIIAKARIDIGTLEEMDIGDFNLTVFVEDNTIIPPPPDSLGTADTDHEEANYYKRGITADEEMEPILTDLQQIEFNKIFKEFIGPIDPNALRLDTLLFGAKAAHLIQLRKKVPLINKYFNGYYSKMGIPNFKCIPVITYRKWQKGEDIDPELKKMHQTIKAESGKVILRSSAVYSEDGEDSVAPGIYESITISTEADFEEFKNTVLKIYESVNSPEAIQYRQENGIEKEEMGIVVQEYEDIEASEYEEYVGWYQGYGFANTVLRNIPELSEMVFDETSRAILTRENAEKRYREGSLKMAKAYLKDPEDPPVLYPSKMKAEHVPYIQLDVQAVMPAEVDKIARQIWILEKLFGKPINVEFAHEAVTNILQVRPIPKKALERIKVNFPKKDPLLKLKALGAGDTELKILPTSDQSNHTKKGVVIFDTTYGRGKTKAELAKQLPKEGAVIVFKGSGKGKGHLETLCAEKNILLLFNPGTRLAGGSEESTDYTDYHGHTSLHIVANGLEGRVYPPKDYIEPKKPKKRQKPSPWAQLKKGWAILTRDDVAR